MSVPYTSARHASRLAWLRARLNRLPEHARAKAREAWPEGCPPPSSFDDPPAWTREACDTLENLVWALESPLSLDPFDVSQPPIVYGVEDVIARDAERRAALQAVLNELRQHVGAEGFALWTQPLHKAAFVRRATGGRTEDPAELTVDERIEAVRAVAGVVDGTLVAQARVVGEWADGGIEIVEANDVKRPSTRRAKVSFEIEVPVVNPPKLDGLLVALAGHLNVPLPTNVKTTWIRKGKTDDT